MQTKYLEAQKELAKMKMQNEKPLVDITTPNGYTIVVANPYKINYKIQRPAVHPVYKTTKSLFGLANSNLATILGAG
ncbi:hypothetical protein AKJ59_00220 [candidate division MSBL1 archaeon SCGC-AAA385M02]|uniref:Uncharacterized protein n=1 Tax=candidate division MSBL1 archaeon SCGC-AAA385M02 TaxID=1698287 RepID=A0A133VR79_9EURY|nr:hypothetical protein AKJ59_00220 [candidate division MSBL1 archaeon SCGC-AAA385M02]